MKTPDEIIQAALKEGRKALFEHEAKELARSVGIVVPKYELAGFGDESALFVAAEKIGYPVAVKAVSPDLLHKTEAGAVMLDIKNQVALGAAVKQIGANVSQRAPGATIRHFLVEKMMPAGPELLIGGLRDEQFGPAIAFGLGGIWTGTLRDAVFGILPLTREEMLDMIGRTKAGMFFQGIRGIAPLDREIVLAVMTAVGKLMTEHRDIREIDLNPLRVYARGAAALDVRIVIGS